MCECVYVFHVVVSVSADWAYVSVCACQNIWVSVPDKVLMSLYVMVSELMCLSVSRVCFHIVLSE